MPIRITYGSDRFGRSSRGVARAIAKHLANGERVKTPLVELEGGTFRIDASDPGQGLALHPDNREWSRRLRRV